VFLLFLGPKGRGKGERFNIVMLEGGKGIKEDAWMLGYF